MLLTPTSSRLLFALDLSSTVIKIEESLESQPVDDIPGMNPICHEHRSSFISITLHSLVSMISSHVRKHKAIVKSMNF